MSSMNYRWILPELDKEILHTQTLHDELSQFLTKYLDSKADMPIVVSINGDNGSGRKFLLSRLAHTLGCPLFLADLSQEINFDELMFSAEMNSAIICVENVKDSAQVTKLIQNLGILFAIESDGVTFPDSREYLILRREIPILRDSDKKQIMNPLLKNIEFEEGIQPLTEPGLAHLNIGALQILAGKLKVESLSSKNFVSKEVFRRTMREMTLHPVPGTSLGESGIYLKDVILPTGQSLQLAEINAFIKCRKQIYQEWGFEKKLPWGRGISVLFYGAPGTGKTMAAAALSNESGLPLLRVDISQVVSKYIGETQKNIGKIFDGATKNDCILFFDEADALFARRGDAGDAQDKHANAETAYLLQRVEQYDGICILATNLFQNFDEAFRRRVGYMLHFPMPDEKQRHGIWQGIFPGEAPVGDLDYGFLARQLELSGASIKNSVVHAAYLAAVNETEITMKYVLLGAKNEYVKLGKALSPQVIQFLENER
ncbi:MAG: ATP-binding protein [Defluviitaleaceae bacterium]|nr:ATP-binding protein [Defluviitaleaceae bacterium]